MFRALKAPGWLCVSDLDAEQGDFHGVTAAEVVKPTRKGELRTFSVFLMTGKKTAK